MTIFRSRRCARFMAFTLVAVLYLIPAACTSAAAAQAAVERQTVVVFPFDKPAQGVPEEIGTNFADSLKASLAGDKSFMVMSFTERVPSVARAVSDGELKKEDLTGPFGTEKEQLAKAVKVASAMAADLVVVGAIDEYKFDDAKKQASITVTAQLADARTGKTLKMASVTGLSPEGSKAVTEQDFIALAAGDAASKVAVGLTPDAKPIDPANPQKQQIQIEQPKKKSSGLKKYLLPLLLAVGIGLAVSGGGDDGGSSGGGDNPPPPL